MVSPTTGVVLVGLGWGATTAISQLALAEKIKQRTSLSWTEIITASALIGFAAVFSYLVISHKD